MADYGVYGDESEYSKSDDNEYDGPAVGALGVLRPDAKGLASVYDTAIQRLKASRSGEPSRAEKLFAISAALGSPTRTGTLGETFGNLSKVLGETTAGAREARTAREDKIAALEFAKAKELAQNEARFAELQMRYGTPKPASLVFDVYGNGRDRYTGKVVAPAPQAVREETRRGVVGQVDPKGSWTPLPEYAQPSAKVLPAPIQKMEESDISDLTIASGLKSDIAAIRSQIGSGALRLDLVGNLVGGAKNALGLSDENSRNLASFRNMLEKMRNDSLRLNKGTQTEGDATRAWNEIMTSLSDQKLVEQRLNEIQALNERAAKAKATRIQQRRTERGVPIADLSAYTDMEAAIGVASPELQAARAEAAKRRGPTTGAAPPIQTWLAAAKKANPGASDADLKAYYATKYGK